tara:strand:+ start:1352 stop:2356 length:1005 start_codon:yes stop_codon:yes gene_type:complete
MAYKNQQFYGAVNAKNILQENFIIATGNVTANSNIITDIFSLDYDISLLRVSQSVFSVNNSFLPSTYITSIAENSITLSSTSSLTQNDTLGFSTPPGTYFFQSASFIDPNNLLTVNDISGSNEGMDYAILGAAKRNGVTVVGRFHIYTISEVVHRGIPTSTLSFFIEWGEPFTELESGDVLQTIETNLAIIDLEDENDLVLKASREIPGLENLLIGSEFAGWNIALNNYLSKLSPNIIDNNVDSYLLTATGTKTLNGEASLRFDGNGLMIGGTGPAQSKLQITGSGELLLIKNDTNSGISINTQGILQLLPYDGEPTVVVGGVYYSGSNFFIGL